MSIHSLTHKACILSQSPAFSVQSSIPHELQIQALGAAGGYLQFQGKLESCFNPFWILFPAVPLTIAIYSICMYLLDVLFKAKESQEICRFVFFPHTLTPILLCGGGWTLVFRIILMASSLGHATIGLRHSMDTGLVGVAGAPSFHCGVLPREWTSAGRSGADCKGMCGCYSLRCEFEFAARHSCSAWVYRYHFCKSHLHMDIQNSNQGEIYIILVW